MITKSDLILLLTNLQEEGIDVQKELRQTFQTNDLMPILKFINSKRQLSATEFYTHIRKSYNHKKSVLYKNIVSEEIAEAEDVLTTLASLNLQILLFCKKL